MKYDRVKQQRRLARLKGYDYAEPGAYFVTIVTQDRTCLFGEINNGVMQINKAGQAIKHWWFELKRKFSTVETDEFVIMPNHLHGIIVIPEGIVGADLRVGPPVERTAHTQVRPYPRSYNGSKQ